MKVKEAEELNILGTTLKQVIDGNLKDTKVCRYAETLRRSLVVIKETDGGIAVTLHFRDGEIEIQNGTINRHSPFQFTMRHPNPHYSYHQYYI